MPELPEVEVTRRGLLPHLPGIRITGVHSSGLRLRRPIPEALLRQCILDEKIAGIDRRAKYLLLRMRGGSVLLIHLGMTGRLGIFPATAPLAKHDHLVLSLEGGRDLRFHDARRFGCIIVWPAARAAEEEERFSRQLGLEPLTGEFTGETLIKLAAGRSGAVKNLLMDSRVIAGVGNIYANESLFAAGIHPATPVNRLSRADWQRLCNACQAILQRAIAAGGSTIADFIGSSGMPGYFQLQLQIYDRGGEACCVCGTVIQKTSIGGRASYFCPHCQSVPKGKK